MLSIETWCRALRRQFPRFYFCGDTPCLRGSSNLKFGRVSDAGLTARHVGAERLRRVNLAGLTVFIASV